jgi:hypothetical protein
MPKFVKRIASNFLATNAQDPLDWTQKSCSGWFRNVSLLHGNRCKTGRTGAINAQVRKTKLRRNFSQRTHPIQSIGPKTNVLGRFVSIRYGTKVAAKLAELVPLTHMFAKRSCIGIFRNKRTWSTPLVPKLIFCDVSDRFVTTQKSVHN